MTAKPKTRKTPAAAVTGINPKLLAIAAKIDESKALARRVQAAQKGADYSDESEHACEKAYGIIYKLEDERPPRPSRN